MSELFQGQFKNKSEYITELKAAVLKRIEEKLRSRSLTVKQLDGIAERMKELDFNGIADKSYLERISSINGKSSFGSDSVVRVGGSQIDSHMITHNSFGTNRETFNELVTGAFADVYGETLESSRERHDEGLAYKDLDISSDELLHAITNVKEEVTEFRKNDLAFEYDKRVIETWFFDMQPDTFECFAKPFLKWYKKNENDVKEEKIQNFHDDWYIRGKVEKIFTSDEDERNRDTVRHLQSGAVIMASMIEIFSPDVQEMTYGMIFELVDRENNRRHPWTHPSKFKAE